MAVSFAVAATDFETSGDGTIYSFTSLSSLTGSPVTRQADNSFLVSSNFTIAAGDQLKVDDGDVIYIADGVEITVNGEAAFNPAGSASFLALDGARPAGFVLGGRTEIANMTFDGVSGILYTGDYALKVKDSTFRNINSEKSLYGVICLLGSSSGSEISGNTFTDCEPGCVNTSVNFGVPMVIENNVMSNCSTTNGLRPFINVSVAAEGEVIIRGNIIRDARLEKPGGIGVSNMMNSAGENKVIVENNEVRDCSWGLNFVGGMDVRILNNRVIDNNADPDVNGGIGATLYSIDAYPQTVYAEGNLFQNNKWGPCTIGATVANFGMVDYSVTTMEHNPGNNVFIGNHHDNAGTDVACDFCNNTAVTAYAQNCYWNDAKTPEEAAATIFGSNYSSSYGPVIYTPINTNSGVIDVTTQARPVIDGNVDVYDLQGRMIFSGDASRFYSSTLPAGTYVLRTCTLSQKIIVR